jgi:hypothetical protein
MLSFHISLCRPWCTSQRLVTCTKAKLCSVAFQQRHGCMLPAHSCTGLYAPSLFVLPSVNSSFLISLPHLTAANERHSSPPETCVNLAVAHRANRRPWRTGLGGCAWTSVGLSPRAGDGWVCRRRVCDWWRLFRRSLQHQTNSTWQDVSWSWQLHRYSIISPLFDTRCFVTVFTKALRLSLPWARRIRSALRRLVPLTYILMAVCTKWRG